MGEGLREEKGLLIDKEALTDDTAAQDSMLSNLLNEINPMRHGRIAMYSFMR